MTRSDFLLAFSTALRRPGVAQMAVPDAAPLRYHIVPPGAFCDPVGLVWWARTGIIGLGTFLDAYHIGLALGLSEEDAIAAVRAADQLNGLTETEAAWQEGYLRAMRLARTFASHARA